MGEKLKLSVPAADPVTFTTNYIRTVVAELRFPALLEMDPKRLAELQAPLRKTYPLYEKQRSLDLAPGAAPSPGEIAHIFRSRDRAWSVTVKNSAIALETTKYTSFPDFEARLRQLLKAGLAFIDSDFFTRVGLRYVNAIPLSGEDLTATINHALVAPLADRVFGTVSKFVQEVRGQTDSGSYTLRHGFAEDMQEQGPHYLLDFDFYAEDVPADRVVDLVGHFRRESFAFFIWCLGPGLRDKLYSQAKR